PRGATPGVPVAEEDDDPAPVGRLLHLAREEFVGDNALPGERMRPQVLVLDLVPGQVHVALGVCEVPTGLYTAERHPHRRRIRPRVAGGFLPRGLRGADERVRGLPADHLLAHSLLLPDVDVAAAAVEVPAGLDVVEGEPLDGHASVGVAGGLLPQSAYGRRGGLRVP